MHKRFAQSLFLGKKVYSLPACHSTNEEAKKLINSGHAVEGTVVFTHRQTGGRGQRGNHWEAEPGKNLTFSLILRPHFLRADNQFGLHLVSSLAIHTALYPILGNRLKIKWPNDIYYEDNKLGGILIENMVRVSFIDYAVVGMGININQLDFDHEHCTSLRAITLEEWEMDEVAEHIVCELERKYLELKNGHQAVLEREYHARLYKYDELQSFEDDYSIFTGRITGVSKQGQLTIDAQGREKSYGFKQIKFLR